jgi:hypothetical protein
MTNKKSPFDVTRILTFVLALTLAALLAPAPAAAGGASTCEIGVSSGTNVISCAVNNGAAGDLTLYTVTIETGAAADVCVCFDSASPAGINQGFDGVFANSAPRVGFASVVATNTQTPTPPPIPPSNAANGLQCVKSNANGRCSVKFKKQ